MKIYTKTGDDGTTGLYGGARVKKYDIIIDSIGHIDELNAYIGLIRSYPEIASESLFLEEIQKSLFDLGAWISVDPAKKSMKMPVFDLEKVNQLEKKIDLMEEKLSPMKYFILPGGNIVLGHIHVARAICRRAERSIVHVAELKEIPAVIVQYINRLSDFLFVFSRFVAYQNEILETPWIPEKK